MRIWFIILNVLCYLFLSSFLEFAVAELLVWDPIRTFNSGIKGYIWSFLIECLDKLTLALVLMYGFHESSLSAFLFTQVVGGIDDQMPSLPSTTGVEVVSYSKLLNQVIACSFSVPLLPLWLFVCFSPVEGWSSPYWTPIPCHLHRPQEYNDMIFP